MLISRQLVPVIADFGLSRLTVVSNKIKPTATTVGTGRWMAIELLDHSVDDHRSTKESDVWAFGMTVLVSMFFECLLLQSTHQYIVVRS